MAAMFLINKLSIYLLTDSNKIIYPVWDRPGCKESQFYSQPFRQAVASMYQPTSHLN